MNEESVVDPLARQLPIDSAQGVREGADGALRWTDEARSLIDGLAVDYHAESGDTTEYLAGVKDQAVLVPGPGEVTLQQWASKQVARGRAVLLGVGVPLSTVDTSPESGVMRWRWMTVLLAVRAEDPRSLAEASRGRGEQRFPIYSEPSNWMRLSAPGFMEWTLFLGLAVLAGFGLRRLVR